MRIPLLAVLAAVFLCLPSTAAAVEQPSGDCKSGGLGSIEWETVVSGDGNVAIHYDDDSLAGKAHSLAGEVQNNIWPEFTRLTGRRPVGDEGVACFGAGDGRLDVYLIAGRKAGGFEFDAKEYAVASPYGATACIAKQPTFIVARGDTVDRFTLAHELWHAFQSAYSRAGDCGEYGNWEEAAATWAAEHVYPRDDREHRYDFTLMAPGFPLNAAAYHAWTLFYSATKTAGDDRIVVRYEENGERMGPDEAVDAALPGGFKRSVPRFALHSWNQRPVRSTWVKKGFAEWDGLKTVPLAEFPASRKGKPLRRHSVEVGRTERLEWDSRVLSRVYSPVKIDDEDAKRITIKNVNAGYPHAAMWAYVRIGRRWQVQNWTGQPEIVFCRDNPAQNVQELVVIQSNTSPKLRVSRKRPTIKADRKCHDGYEVTFTGTTRALEETTCPPRSWDFSLTRDLVTGTTQARYTDGLWDIDDDLGSGDVRGTHALHKDYYAVHMTRGPEGYTEDETQDTIGGFSIQGDGPRARITLNINDLSRDESRTIDADALRRGEAQSVTFEYTKQERSGETCSHLSEFESRGTLTFTPAGGSSPLPTSGPE